MVQNKPNGLQLASWKMPQAEPLHNVDSKAIKMDIVAIERIHLSEDPY